ncbi:hypothetical protein EMIT0P100_10955 [Pseudomonas sp. IT-P100]
MRRPASMPRCSTSASIGQSINGTPPSPRPALLNARRCYRSRCGSPWCCAVGCWPTPEDPACALVLQWFAQQAETGHCALIEPYVPLPTPSVALEKATPASRTRVRHSALLISPWRSISSAALSNSSYCSSTSMRISGCARSLYQAARASRLRSSVMV